MTLGLPTSDKRTAIIGSTGSGKTQFAVWLLSTRDFDKRVWIIFDFKGDALIDEIGPIEIDVSSPIPKNAGLYVVRPIPERDDSLVVQMLWNIWAQENVGIYVDEGYMLGVRNSALNACLTQGRSKNIEMIILSQRPKWMSKFVFSEANYFAVFNLTLEEDRKFVAGYVNGKKINLLPRFHSLWYCADNQKSCEFGPVPSRSQLIETFNNRLKKRVKTL